MRRADRLFQLIQHLHSERVITARDLAEALQVSERTIYRDIQDLCINGVPIIGEAGVGYRLMKGFQLPPLMFTEEELAALLLGVRMVQAWSDEGLTRAATHILQKIESVIPEHLRPELTRQQIIVPDFSANTQVSKHLTLLRDAVRIEHKVSFQYIRADGQPSSRVVHPLGLFYWGKVWTLVAWCELRQEFRHFRLDRMEAVVLSGESYDCVPGRTLQDFLATVCDSG